jgi:DNA-binding GntR family transcriptional regulator
MDFRGATDKLGAAITHDDIARQLGISVQSIRQARMNGDSLGQRKPPDNWKVAPVALAESRITYFKRLIEQQESERRK